MSRSDPEIRPATPIVVAPAIPADEEEPRRTIHILGRTISLPRSRATRITIGCSLVVLGCFGFLPVLGFWMIPLGLLVLSYEFASIRRWRRRSSVWWGNRRGGQYRARTRRHQP